MMEAQLAKTEEKVSWSSAMALIGIEGVPPPPFERTPEELITFAEKWFSLPARHFSRKSDRKQNSVSVRNVVRQYLHHNYTLSLARIGFLTCRTDHSNVIHSLNNHNLWMGNNFEYRNLFNAFSAAALAEGFREAVK